MRESHLTKQAIEQNPLSLFQLGIPSINLADHSMETAAQIEVRSPPFLATPRMTEAEAVVEVSEILSKLDLTEDTHRFYTDRRFEREGIRYDVILDDGRVLQLFQERAEPKDTYTIRLWQGHPCHGLAVDDLETARNRSSDLVNLGIIQGSDAQRIFERYLEKIEEAKRSLRNHLQTVAAELLTQAEGQFGPAIWTKHPSTSDAEVSTYSARIGTEPIYARITRTENSETSSEYSLEIERAQTMFDPDWIPCRQRFDDRRVQALFDSVDGKL